MSNLLHLLHLIGIVLSFYQFNVTYIIYENTMMKQHTVDWKNIFISVKKNMKICNTENTCFFRYLFINIWFSTCSSKISLPILLHANTSTLQKGHHKFIQIKLIKFLFGYFNLDLGHAWMSRWGSWIRQGRINHLGRWISRTWAMSRFHSSIVASNSTDGR